MGARHLRPGAPQRNRAAFVPKIVEETREGRHQQRKAA
jgi:hypothetical protein